MPQFLFVVDMPNPGISSDDPDASTRWFAFAKESSAIALPRTYPPKPAKNSWLLLAEGSDTILSQLIVCAQKHQFPHSTFLISGEVTSMTLLSKGKGKE